MDLLLELDKGKDIKLSTAVVMGARFPYLSPAGRIGNSYFVDGGYFDNSGAGFANEILLGLEKYILSNKQAKPFLAKLRFYIIHAQNGYYSTRASKVHPAINDLAAPILTLVGAYGTQTSVNDWRLQKYMESLYPNEINGAYWKVNLYSDIPSDKSDDKNPEFPMNWVISQYYIKKMNNKLRNKNMTDLIDWMRGPLKL
jgi:hypothetical protein